MLKYRSASQPRAREAAPGGSHRQLTIPSQLLSSLFERIPADRPLEILDIGGAEPETLDFFSHYRCRLHIADLLGDLEASYPETVDNQPPSDREWLLLFRRLVDFPAGTRFDLCLFWDLFSYFDESALRAFSQVLTRWLGEGCRGHAFAVVNKNASLPSRRYGLLEEGLLLAKPVPERSLPVFRRPQGRLTSQLTCFEVGRSVLHGDGRLEMLLWPPGQ